MRTEVTTKLRELADELAPTGAGTSPTCHSGRRCGHSAPLLLAADTDSELIAVGTRGLGTRIEIDRRERGDENSSCLDGRRFDGSCVTA